MRRQIKIGEEYAVRGVGLVVVHRPWVAEGKRVGWYVRPVVAGRRHEEFPVRTRELLS